MEEINTNSQNMYIAQIDEQSQIIKDIDLNFIFVLSEVYKINNYKKKYKLLSTIDLYGDTVFNAIQAKMLIKELESLLKTMIRERFKHDIIKLLNFIKDSIKTPHTYIKFFGD